MSKPKLYENYIIDSKIKNTEKSYFFIFNENKLLLINEKIPLIKDINQLNLNIERKIYLGEFYSKDAYVVEIKYNNNNNNNNEDNRNYHDLKEDNDSNKDNHQFYDLREVYEINEELYLLAGRAIQLRDWDKNHQFCGRCGSKTYVSDIERARVCPECGFMSFTRISPAIITAIIKDDSLLMAKHSYHKEDRYALVAGFIEAGETIEEAAHREVKEEVGINIKNLKYFGSQSWPFPNSLMIGFISEYESGDIKVDNNEIIDAKWFKKDEIKQLSSNISIASDLIKYFIENY